MMFAICFSSKLPVSAASSSDIATDSRVEARVRECAPGGERGEREEGPSVGSSAARTKTLQPRLTRAALPVSIH